MDLDELARRHGFDISGEPGDAKWLAGLVNEVLEDAARECEAAADEYERHYDCSAERGADVCANRIRALKLNYPLADKRK